VFGMMQAALGDMSLGMLATAQRAIAAEDRLASLENRLRGVEKMNLKLWQASFES